MTKEYGVTHFTELHRTLHKNFLIWRWPTPDRFLLIQLYLTPEGLVIGANLAVNIVIILNLG